MSKEKRYCLSGSVPLRSIASVMVRPMTNWRPSMRIACRKAARITGSPQRATSREIMLPASIDVAGVTSMSRPVNINPQVEAFTNTESLRPT